MIDFVDKAIAITGAGSGLGAVMADLFAAQGARLAVLDIDGDRVETRAGEFVGRGIDALGVALRLPAGLATRQLESSMAARPTEPGASRLDTGSIQAMTAEAAIGPTCDMVAPDVAIRNLLAELEAGSPCIVTHAGYRNQVEAQQRSVLAAFERRAAGPGHREREEGKR